MRLTIAKRWSLCGVAASALILGATASLPITTGACGVTATLACDPNVDAGADHGGEGGGDAGCSKPDPCDFAE